MHDLGAGRTRSVDGPLSLRVCDRKPRQHLHFASPLKPNRKKSQAGTNHETESIITQCVHSGLVQFGGNVSCWFFIDQRGGVTQKFGASCHDEFQELERDETISVIGRCEPAAVLELIVLNAVKRIAVFQVCSNVTNLIDAWKTASLFHGHSCLNLVSI